MSRPQARLGDMCLCALFAPSPAGPVPGMSPIAMPCAIAPPVLIGGIPAARVSDMHIGLGPHPVSMGSMTVTINKLPAARIGDMTACGGAVTVGLPTVLVGG